jgi:hypothetical protein
LVNHKRYYEKDKHGFLFMDPKTPAQDPQQSDNGLIMPDPAGATDPVVTPEPTSIPVNTTPVAEPTPVPEPEPIPEPAAPEAPAVPEPAPIPVNVAATAVPVPKPEAPVEPMPAPVAEPLPTPPLTPEEPAAPEAPAEPDPLFAEVTEPDPLDVDPQPVAPTPEAPVTDQAMNQLDDSSDKPVVAATGQTVVATSKPHKSRKKTMIILIIGLILAGAAGFAAYQYFTKDNVAETEAPAAILNVQDLSPENLKQATDKTELKAGSQTNAKVLTFSGTAPTDAPAGTKIQIEIQPLGTDFTGTPLEDTVAVPDQSDPLKVAVTDYEPGSYHWQARLSDGTNNGPWVAFSTGDETGKTADFTIDREAPTAATLKTVNGKTVASKTFTSTVAQPVLTGTTAAGSTISVAFNESMTYKATVATDGTWTVTAGAAIPNGKYTMTITTTDAAGNSVASTYTVTQSAK